jgi:glycine betaine/proline transport system substrate-binding protein
MFCVIRSTAFRSENSVKDFRNGVRQPATSTTVRSLIGGQDIAKECPGKSLRHGGPRHYTPLPFPFSKAGVMQFGRRLALVLLLAASAFAQEPRRIRFADVGWTDVTATTAIAVEVLRSLGYETETQLLAVPVTFVSLKTGDIDVFLGNWMPTQANDVKPFLAEGAFVDLTVNLEGALFTFAVPSYVHAGGVKSAADLAKFKDKFGGKIYGIEPGNEGNRIVLDLIKNDIYGMGGWQLIESSEQGMLTEVRHAASKGDWILFFGWKPHPMNTSIQMEYLADPLLKWGPGGGASQVHTIISKRFEREHPELVPFFKNLKFSMDMENELMTEILDHKKDPGVAAREWLAKHPEMVAAWLKDGPKPKEGALAAHGNGAANGHGMGFRVPLGAWIDGAVKWVTTRFSTQLRAISETSSRWINMLVARVAAIPPPWIIVLLVVVSIWRQRSPRHAVGMLFGTMLIWNLGYWEATVQTLALVTIASAISVVIGVPVGILAARYPLLFTLLRPVLDTMQTIPTFVYLIPTLMLFGLGIVPGLLSTIIFAIPAAIRLTHLGITSVPAELIEAGVSFGARPVEVLAKIEIPHAMPAILEGVSQTLMLSLSMVVISALVGAEGLGTPVVRALNTVNVAMGFEAGLSIVIVAILLDRLVRRPAVAAAHSR